VPLPCVDRPQKTPAEGSGAPDRCAAGLADSTVGRFALVRRRHFRPGGRSRSSDGYTLYSAQSGALVARLRPTASDDNFEVLYWYWYRWTSTGPLGRTVLSIDDALRFIAYEVANATPFTGRTNELNGLFRIRIRLPPECHAPPAEIYQGIRSIPSSLRT
jgi:hypothetical protein